MSVETFNPGATGVQMSEAAAAHARRQLQRSGASAVRLGVKRSGCSGFSYQVDYVVEPEGDDTEFQVADNLAVYVSQDALPLVQGTEIDLVTEGLNSVLRFRNPNAVVECGCGESFAV